jgi:alkanesulfonate monooxygenase SsuD/methylene tetrahydromethanopterin reductase-like flavin-dependent oxidoreductase (luciferase family)
MAVLEPLTTLAGLAARTSRVRMGTLVLGAPFRHPVLLAKAAATIDALTEGRLDLGLGAGWFQEEFEAFGMTFGSLGERFTNLEETLRALDALFTGSGAGAGDPVTFEADVASIHGARLLPPPVQRPRIPLWVGGKGGPRLLRLAAELADGWNTVWRWSPDAYAGRVEAAHRACIAAGRDPATMRLSVGLYALVGEDASSVRSTFERARATMPGDAMHQETLETWSADTLSGTPDQILERIERFDRLGVEELIIAPWIQPFVIPEAEQVEMFAERVIAPWRSG